MPLNNIVPAELPKGECLVAVVAESPGATEVIEGVPLIGRSGELLFSTLKKLGIQRENCLSTNVFNERPPNNDEAHFFNSPAVIKERLKQLGLSHKDATAILNNLAEPPTEEIRQLVRFGRLDGVGFVKNDYHSQLERLKGELEAHKPKVIIGFGNVALWALTGKNGITTHRGTFFPSTLVDQEVVCTFHPANVLRLYKNRTAFASDIQKATRTILQVGQVSKPKEERRVHLVETISDLDVFGKQFLSGPCKIAVDVETENRQISCFSIAVSEFDTLAIPILDKSKKDWHYWPLEDELHIWGWTASLLSRKDVTKIFHNATYDLSYFWHHGIPTLGLVEDTMLMHHALQPEMQKGLGFLVSLYFNEWEWKSLRTQSKVNINKKDG